MGFKSLPSLLVHAAAAATISAGTDHSCWIKDSAAWHKYLFLFLLYLFVIHHNTIIAINIIIIHHCYVLRQCMAQPRLCAVGVEVPKDKLLREVPGLRKSKSATVVIECVRTCPFSYILYVAKGCPRSSANQSVNHVGV